MARSFQRDPCGWGGCRLGSARGRGSTGWGAWSRLTLGIGCPAEARGGEMPLGPVSGSPLWGLSEASPPACRLRLEEAAIKS